jgi:GntR family transcriptional repressor for pyruvate dehydrogenase complex
MTTMLAGASVPVLPSVRQVTARVYLRQDAAAELRRYILAANLAPGDKLPSERELCAQLGLSRTSVREAMRFLEHEGLLEIRQGRPAVVRPLDLSPMIDTVLERLAAERNVLRDLVELRPALEIFAARAAAGKRTDADIAELERCLSRVREALEQGSDTVEDDVLFHDLLYRAAQNSVLLTFSRTVHGFLRAVREAALEVGGSARKSWEQHTAILAAVREGDADAAGAAMQRHMDVVAQEQERALSLLDEVAQQDSTAGRRRAGGVSR